MLHYGLLLMVAAPVQSADVMGAPAAPVIEQSAVTTAGSPAVTAPAMDAATAPAAAKDTVASKNKKNKFMTALGIVITVLGASVGI